MDSMEYNSRSLFDSSGRDSSDFWRHQGEMDSQSSVIPRWKIPLSKSFSANFYGNERTLISPVVEEDSGRRSKTSQGGGETRETDYEPDPIIQILLPCIICNGTFSPEALERHSKVCVKVEQQKPSRPTYDSHAMRIKNTRVADFIPPPDLRDPPPFSRSSSLRRSQGRGSIRERTPSGSVVDVPVSRHGHIRSASIPKTLAFHDHPPPPDSFGANSSEFGSSEDSAENAPSGTLPSYARALSPSEDCPYCLRSFGLKAYDRHVSFCRDVWERRQFEIQPTPKEVEEARERQDVRTKYRPMKGSNSCSSLRSVSPGKDPVHNFATVALNKLFGGGLKSGGGNYNFKKSNDSLASSCYGDFARSRSLRHPSPAAGRGMTTSLTSKIPTPMRVNTNSNLPSKTKSTERLDSVPSSGYGQGGHYMTNFSRNSKMRNSLGRNFFRNGKRVEPEGLENTNNSNLPPSASPLIITPINFYNKGAGVKIPGSESTFKSTMLSSDPKYDPYEKAAKQLEELLKTQPQHPQRANTQRKLGLDRAMASIMTSDPQPKPTAAPRQSYNQMYSFLREEDPFSNISADEGYWEEILRAKKKEKEQQQKEAENNSNNRARSNYVRPLELDSQRGPRRHEGDEKRDSSDSSVENFKYRGGGGVSNISSADSAFSRSDGTDLEFEALESLLSVGDGPRKSNAPAIPSSKPPPEELQRLPEINYRQPIRIRGTNNPDTSGARTNETLSKIKDNQPGLHPTYAKFCHECGIPYPSPVAKFCPECGERRVINV